jgi:hypothetical protein
MGANTIMWITPNPCLALKVISVGDLNFIFLICFQHNNKGHHEKKSNLNALLLLLPFDQINYGFSIPEQFFGPLYHACTLILLCT